MALYSLDGRSVATPGAGRFWVAAGASVIGAVTLEDDVSVWFGAVVRGDNEPVVLRRRTNVQDNAVLHTDPGFPMTVGPDATIGHLAVVHGSTIGENVLVGMGAVLLNGCRIGDNCIIGAKALIPEGRVIEPGSLVVGAPGRVVRKLGREEIARVREAAEIYNARWRRYAAGLKAQPA